MKKILYIIPGFKQSADDDSYIKISYLFEEKGYIVHSIAIKWAHRTMSDYITEAKSQINTTDEHISILGFSFGAFIAAVLATSLHLDTLYICSLSPYFKEIIPIIPSTWKKALGIKRMRDFQKYSLIEITKNTTTNIHFFQGEKELTLWPSMVQCAQIARANYKNFMYYIVPNIGHVIHTKEYIAAIKQVMT